VTMYCSSCGHGEDTPAHACMLSQCPACQATPIWTSFRPPLSTYPLEIDTRTREAILTLHDRMWPFTLTLFDRRLLRELHVTAE
jgi:hypothetical protein